MENQDFSKREHIHVQNSPFRFQTVMWAPEKGSTKARFAIESMVYVTGMGWDIVDPMTQGNEFWIGFRNYVKMKELSGYVHVGLSSDQLTNMMKNLWPGWDGK